MDEEYVRMCQEAKEIQEAWKPKSGDSTRLKEDGIKLNSFLPDHCILIQDMYHNADWIKKTYLWLPRQEDLQEIYMDYEKLHVPMNTFEKFMNWLFDFFMNKLGPAEGDYEISYSYKKHNGLNMSVMRLNEAWLCFVMETCYGKRWNGETWEKMR